MKRFINLLLLIVAILSIATGCSNQDTKTDTESETDTSVVSQISPKTTEHKNELPDDYIGIYTVDDLINSDYNRDVNYMLMNDLDLSDIDEWNGIVNSATFDGNNYTIYNLKSINSGLFKNARDIKNITLKNVDILVNDENVYSLACLSSTAQNVENCTVYGKLEYKTGNVVIGGLLGSLNGSMTNCKSYVDIVVRGFRVSVGGLVGISYKGSAIDFCDFYGSIDAVGNIGGICGNVAEGDVTINASRNEGNICISEKSENNDYVGGILGLSDNGVIVQNCSNLGNITDNYTHEYGYEYSGIVGYGYDKITIRNCYNSGIISTVDSTHILSSITGCNSQYDLDISNCAYLSNDNISITPTNAMFLNCKAMTETELKNISNYPFDNINEWENTDNSFPQYIGQ